ncbi:serine protease [Gigaspora margarita]|uniref:Serine protease n=1 Tax=Gigaspora margarita TaxID=4874 RepID=A0A8H3WYY7_GIGMA|nr:serine protease [Gigaspora margarita]
MKNIYIYLKTLLISFAFILQNCSIVHAQICSKTNPINCLQFEPLARLWNVSNEEVPRLLDLEKNLISIDSKLQPLLNGLYFGGTYLDIKVGKINVNTVDQSKVDEIRNKMKNSQDYLNFIAVNNTLSQLNSTFNQTFILAQQLNITNCIISIEPEFNNVVIYLNGGSKIVSVDQDNRRILACSAGFWMIKNIEDFIVTAGHCPENFPSLFYVYSFQDDHLIGPMNSRIRPYDMGFIKQTNTNIMLRPVIRQFDHIILRFLQFLIVGSSEITSCGIHICKAGQRTGITCGFVSAFNSVNIVDGRPMMRTITAPINNYPGDSGGPIFRYNDHNADAVGIVVAGFPSHLLASMPISLAYDLGYSLVTIYGNATHYFQS